MSYERAPLVIGADAVDLEMLSLSKGALAAADMVTPRFWDFAYRKATLRGPAIA